MRFTALETIVRITGDGGASTIKRSVKSTPMMQALVVWQPRREQQFRWVATGTTGAVGASGTIPTMRIILTVAHTPTTVRARVRGCAFASQQVCCAASATQSWRNGAQRYLARGKTLWTTTHLLLGFLNTPVLICLALDGAKLVLTLTRREQDAQVHALSTVVQPSQRSASHSTGQSR
jgi:hypothetical protein